MPKTREPANMACVATAASPSVKVAGAVPESDSVFTISVTDFSTNSRSDSRLALSLLAFSATDSVTDIVTNNRLHLSRTEARAPVEWIASFRFAARRC